MAVKDDIFALADPVVTGLGYQLVEVEYVKEGPRWFVRLYLYSPNGVSLDDCRAVNDALAPVLEAQDPVKNPYVLEISSPGAERVLKTDRELFIFEGKLVKVTLREALNGQPVVLGHLGPATAETVSLTDENGQPLSLSRDSIKQIRLSLLGTDLDQLAKLSAAAQAKMRAIPGVVDLDSSLKPNKPTIDIVPKRDIGSDLGIGVAQLRELPPDWDCQFEALALNPI